MNVGNNNKITLIIPDLHLRWQQAQKIIDSVKADQIIFLGDFFDDFNDDPTSIGEMADWLENSVRQPNRIHLYGNHDVHYAYSARHLQCSGYADWKYFAIRDRIDHKHVWDQFKWFHILDGKWLLSHGGLHKFHLPAKIANLHADRPKFMRELEAYLTAESRKAFRDGSWFTHAGYSRGGSQRVGGLTWCDFEREFFPVKGLNQIVGHTPQGLGVPKWCYLKGNSQVIYHPYGEWTPNPKDYNDVQRSYNIDLDVWKNTHWAIWDGEQLRVFNYQEDL